jgi:hypothetical protein
MFDHEITSVQFNRPCPVCDGFTELSSIDSESWSPRTVGERLTEICAEFLEAIGIAAAARHHGSRLPAPAGTGCGHPRAATFAGTTSTSMALSAGQERHREHPRYAGSLKERRASFISRSSLKPGRQYRGTSLTFSRRRTALLS